MQRSSLPPDPVLRGAAIMIIVTLGFAVLWTATDILAPMVLGLVTGVILAPVTDMLERTGLPHGIVAALVVVFGGLIIAMLIFLAEPVVWRVAEELPRIKWELRTLIQEFRGLFQSLNEMNQEVKEALGSKPEAEGENADPAIPSVTAALLLAPLVISQILIFAGVLFFFLLTRKRIYAWLSNWIGSSADTVIIQQRFTNAERLVSRYFLTISVINAGLGAALGGALALIGLPGAFVWGVVAALANFILYMGPMMVTAGLLIAGLVTFNGLMVLLPPAIFLGLNMLEAQFVTPTFLGKRIAVNPLLIFISLVVWLWLWGPIGGIIAIPVLVIAMVMLDIFEDDEDEA
ncbi:AI-2E family transporter [uncultured Roseovarius sp.]|nr:AI-2E family transporter [uncultured Roseovarius sp.]